MLNITLGYHPRCVWNPESKPSLYQTWFPQMYFHTVDASDIPRPTQPPFGCIPNPVNNEISTTHLNWLYRRIFEPSTVCGQTNLQAFNLLISRAMPVCTKDMRNIASPILRCTECRSNDDNLLPLLRQKTPTGGYQKMGK